MSHVLVSLVLGLHTQLALDTLELHAPRGVKEEEDCFSDKSQHKFLHQVENITIRPSPPATRSEEKTAWDVSTCARAAFSLAELSKLQSKQRRGLSKSLLLCDTAAIWPVIPALSGK